MHDILTIGLAGAAGGALGALFFGGLWWTVHKGVTAKRPELWFLGSLLLRMGITLAGFYVIADGRWQRLLSCLVGFTVARMIVTWFTRQPGKRHNPPAQETGHAA